MRRFQCLGNLLEDRERLLERNGSTGYALGQRLARYILERQEVDAILFLEAVNTGYVGVVQRGDDACFPFDRN